MNFDFNNVIVENDLKKLKTTPPLQHLIQLKKSLKLLNKYIDKKWTQIYNKIVKSSQ